MSTSRFVVRALSAVLATLMAWAPIVQVAQAQDHRLRDGVEIDTRELYPHVSEDLSYEAGPVDVAASSAEPYSEEETPLPDAPAYAPSTSAVPGSQEASAVTPQAISLPNAEGSIEGMGESFSPVLSSGTATFSVPIAVAPGRAGVAPALSLSYSSTSGNGPVGFGWSLGVPFISRQTDRGLPRYVDRPQWHGEEDRFMYNGGQELVPVANDAIGRIDASASMFGATSTLVPSEVRSWQQYRARVEGAFMRFFRAPNGTRWLVQAKDGTRFDFGLLPSTEAHANAVTQSRNALERDPDRSDGAVYRWMLTRMTDPHGSTVYYLYDQYDGFSYLADIYYVSPASCAGGSVEQTRRCAEPLTSYGARVHLFYEERADAFASYVSGWRIAVGRRLRRIDIGAYDDAAGARTAVRRYHLRYASDSFHSLLTQLQVEGRSQRLDASVGAYVGNRQTPELPPGGRVVGELLPPMTFEYSRMPSGGDDVPGFGTIDATAHDAANSPPHSVDDARSDLFDVNGDGLPDLIVTDPARYRTADGQPAVGVFFNGFTGADAAPAGEAAHFSGAVAMPMRSNLSHVLNLGNLNVVPMDIDGDGRSDLLHMPRLRTYGWWAPTRAADGAMSAVSPAEQGWRWTYAQIDLPADDTDPRIDLGRDNGRLRVLDVNNDHLIDVVRTTGTVMQTWLNLGGLPGGDGRFGSYEWRGTYYELSTEPIESCVLHAGLPVSFEDPEVRLADLNGDGLQDIAKIRRGRVIYWAGRGPGSFGDGPRECGRNEGANRYVEMTHPPGEIQVDLDGVYFNDVDMDGASDLVQVRFRDVDVYFNRAGHGWTDRTTVHGTPANPGFASRIRFADLDGSGTTDIVWADAHDWKYIDPTGGRRPRLLVGVDNGLGAHTTIEYGSSAEDYVADLHAAAGCRREDCERFTWGEARGEPDARLAELSNEYVYRSAGSPVVSTVVRSVRTTDRMNWLGREAQVSERRFTYHDGYYEGIEQEFRGFGAADAISVGDWNNPTVHSRTWFEQGRRPSEIADDRLADNPNEALKGREVLTEVFDEDGTYLSSSLATLTDRLMLTGLDGREIHYAYVSETNELRYDTSPFGAGSGTVEVPAVVRERLLPSGALDGAPVVERRRALRVRGARAARVRTTFDQVDAVGHVRQQTAHGQVDLATGADLGQAIVQTQWPAFLNTDGQWMWRTWRTYVQDSGTPTPLSDTVHSYSLYEGDLIASYQTAGQPQSFEFAGESAEHGGARGYVQSPEDAVASTIFDAWGNPRISCAGMHMNGRADVASPPEGCLRFGYVEYDSQYAQVAVREHLAVGRGVYLDYEGTWDRGLGAVVSSTDPNALTSTVTYDGLGRLTSVTPPNVAGCSGATPTTRVRYELTASPEGQPLSRVVTTTELDCDGTLGEDGGALVSVAYVDGLGRARAALSTGDDAHAWVRGGVSTLDAKGTVRRSYQSDFYDGSDTDLRAVLRIPAAAPYTVTRYDAFSRPVGVIAEDGATTWTSYHSLSTDVCDPLDNDPASPHYRTCTTARADGHGRVVDQVLRNRSPDTGAIESYRRWSYYRADGAVLALVRAETNGARPPTWTGALPERRVVRTFSYDTLGRRLSSDDPDTDDPSNADEGSNSWRYLFNRVGDLVAARDPRGCGQNFYYDLGGRLVGEQYVHCAEAQDHRAELPPLDNLVGGLVALNYEATPVRLDVVYHYDELPAWSTDYVAGGPMRGRATGVSDRGQRAALAYDDRGNVIVTVRQMAWIPDELPLSFDVVGGRPRGVEGTAPAGEVIYDDGHTYERASYFDHAGRPTAMRLPVDPDYGSRETGPPSVGGVLEYNRRGLPARAAAVFDCAAQFPQSLDEAREACHTVQLVIQSVDYLRDGLVASTTYGDTYESRSPTVSTVDYDVRRRPIRMRTVREPTSSEGLGAVDLPFDQELVWDAASNLTAQIDHRDAAAWPDGHRPQTVHIAHDSLYRVIGAEYEYTGADGNRTPHDLGTDWRSEYAAAYAHDPMRQRPAPMTSSLPSDRVASLTWSWDYLANTTEWTDDQQSFHERSLGRITNGDDASGALRPSALYVASNIPASPSDLTYGGAGWLEVDYGAGGNLTALTVHGQCGDSDAAACTDDATQSVSARRAHLRASCECAAEQHYEYRWDELDRLAEARRYDRTAETGGAWQLRVRQRHRYDAANQRTVKQTLDEEEGSDPPTPGLIPRERVALYVYPGDYERRGLVRGLVRGLERYQANADLDTETQYVIAGARTVWRQLDPTRPFDRDHRLTIGLGDLIQTTAAVMDVRTGELLESSTYYPNGARETHRIEDAALVAPEPAGFTGKEADEEVGLVYFGERYLVPRLGRWASPDPLHVHAVGGGEALNSFHYVGGNLLEGRDPIGLDWVDELFDHLSGRRFVEGLATLPERLQNDARIEDPRSTAAVAMATAQDAAGGVADAAVHGLSMGRERDLGPALDEWVNRDSATYRAFRSTFQPAFMPSPAPVVGGVPPATAVVTSRGSVSAVARAGTRVPICGPVIVMASGPEGSSSSERSSTESDSATPASQPATSQGGLRAFHGTSGNNILSLLEQGALVPRNGKIFLSEIADDTFVHGADRARRAAFSVELEIHVDAASISRRSLPGNPRSIVVDSARNVSVSVRRLFVRTPNGEGGFSTEVVEGEDAIRRFLSQ